MKAIDIARRFAELQRIEEAVNAYTIAIHQREDDQPEDELEAALFLLRFGGDYKIAYTSFVRLYNKGLFQDLLLGVMMDAFYKPNEKMMKSRYEKNCKRLEKYKYCFKKDFLPFEQLPVRFFPYDESGYVPFYISENRFGEYVDFEEPVIKRNFFADLEKPVFAPDVYSQYELSYLRDNVRRSDWVGRENHIYLHYTDFALFCSHLQTLNLRPLLEEEKFVFLMEEEKELYPIDFKARFGIDYSTCPLRPVGIREVTRLIWHCQLTSHNGGDFFNEVFDDHPNLLTTHSIIFKDLSEMLQKPLKDMNDPNVHFANLTVKGVDLGEEILQLKNVTQKDILVAWLLAIRTHLGEPIDASRIVPAVLFQPHFKNIFYDFAVDEKGRACLYSDEYEKIKESDIFNQFKYIKTFAPLRRLTTSHAASLKFAVLDAKKNFEESGKATFVPDAVLQRTTARNYLADPRDKLFKDSVIVRFEDAKINPKATFAALAAFCDVPYARSMTYCSLFGERDPESIEGNDIGFSTAAVYRKYEDYVNQNEGAYIEYFMRDAYETYGYDFHYYDGTPMDEARAEALVDGFDCCDGYLIEAWERLARSGEWLINGKKAPAEGIEDYVQAALAKKRREFKEGRLLCARTLLKGLRFVSRDGQPLRMLPLLKPNDTLLEQPLYR